MTPQKALEENLLGIIPLSPPTVVTLTQLSCFTLVDALKNEIKTRPWGDPLAPCLVSSSQGPVILEPWDPQWQTPGDMTLSTLSEKVLPPGAPFSRIWCDNGVWKPVGL